MSRRTGQNGHFERSGKWWVVRWWMDVPGQKERKLKRAKVCPISGPRSLSDSERKCRGREIIAESDADTVEYFNKVVNEQRQGVVSFRDQGERWLHYLRTRKLRRHLHPALKKLGYTNPFTGDHKAGSHAFRRFRNTYLKNETSSPKGLPDYWLGHKGDSMNDLYDKVKLNVVLRKKWAAECGLGFDLPASIVPNVPKYE